VISEEPKVSERILVRMMNDEIRSLDENSPLTLRFPTIRRLYVFGPPNISTLKKNKDVCERKFGVKSDLTNL